jgi:hypothetical protein
MSIYYSAATGGFYDSRIYSVMPGDAVEISKEKREELLKGQASGKIIIPGANGIPTLETVSETPPKLTCTAWQIRSALNKLGWRQLVENAVANSADQDLKDAWQFSQSFTQDHPKVLQISQSIGKTEADLQTLFELAITLNP